LIANFFDFIYVLGYYANGDEERGHVFQLKATVSWQFKKCSIGWILLVSAFVTTFNN